GTRFVPGTHLRKVSEAAIGRYQNIRGQQHMVCPAGTLLFLHHGIWHGGGVNRSDHTRYMFKIRAHASGRQTRAWDLSDWTPPAAQRPIFYRKAAPAPGTVETILTTPEPWFEADTGRLEFVNRIKLWRYLTEDPSYDADYWLTRLEAEAPRSVSG
ncbi:MAG TPA: phytanoyl-CoA dioxygenase family protein, partial [Caulobacteraceae bacterium]|nr:phytanoyl-CoA dioxygenase family protein [Caulobacteraceae bacterium]